MMAAINLDGVQDSNTKKLLVDFTDKTVVECANAEVWEKSFCFENQTSHAKKSNYDYKYCVSTGSQNVAFKWDIEQERKYVQFRSRNSNIRHEKEDESTQSGVQAKNIEKLLEKKHLNVAYDKLPLSYGGHRPHMALDIPLEKLRVPYTHPKYSQKWCEKIYYYIVDTFNVRILQNFYTMEEKYNKKTDIQDDVLVNKELLERHLEKLVCQTGLKWLIGMIS